MPPLGTEELAALRKTPTYVVALALGSLSLPATGFAQTPQRARTVSPTRLQVAAPTITWDFETGDLRGWRATGEAFSAQPTYGDNPRARGAATAGHQGDYWIGTFERNPRPVRTSTAGVQGDRPQGTLTSTPFTIPEGNLSFLIGGGAAFETRVELRVLDPIESAIRVLHASGDNSETMRRQVWDLSPWAGRRGFIRIVDESSERWGHINVDDFRFPATGTIDPGVLRVPLENVELQQRPPTPPPEEEPARVPGVVGRHVELAAELLADAGLAVGQVGERVSERRPGTVLLQEPQAGSLVPLKTPVSLVVAVAPERPETGPEEPLPRRVRVPDLSGRTEAVARQLVERSGLAVGSVRSLPSPGTPGTVIDQSPAPGTPALLGTAVSFALAEAETVVVPDLVGRPAAEALAILEGLRLVGRISGEQESAEPPGTVLAQAVQPGARVELGSAVGFTVATPITVIVPDVVGRPAIAARRLLTAAGLAIGNVRRDESRQPASSVIVQRNPPGSRVPIGTAVDLVVAIPVTVEVPDLVGRSGAAASGVLEGMELGAGVVTSRESREPAGTVLAQSPEPGTGLAIGSTVDYVVAEPVTVVVPELVGRSETEARRLLAEAELEAGAVGRRESREIEGSVLAQGVEAGSRAEVGTAIDLEVAIPVTVLVPELVGAAEPEARALLSAAELVPGEIQDQESPAAPGTVLAQGLNPGSRVPVGTAVSLVVAVVETVPVPSVVELPVEEARRRLVVGRLGVGAEEERESREIEAGIVMEQGRPAGTQAAVGSPVSLVVATPEMVTVPGLVGLSRQEAVAAITAAGLTPGGTAEQFSVQPGGTVLSQAQPVGSQVVFGTSVGLEVARPRIVWAGPLGLFLAALAAVGGLRLIARRTDPPPDPRQRRPRPVVELPELGLRPVPDPGEASMGLQAGQGTGLEIRLRPVVDAGSQRLDVEADLIAGESRDE